MIKEELKQWNAFDTNWENLMIPDAEDLLGLASRSGYVLWSFRPVHGGIWAEVADDATLRSDGTRKPPCPHHPVPPGGRKMHRTVYRFGVSAGGFAAD